MRAEDVLVTGGTGFLGRRLCRRLDADGCRVGVLSRRERPPADLDDAVSAWHVGDVRDADAVDAAVAAHDAVFHLAGVGLADADPQTVESVNRDGTRVLLDACREHETERVVFASTAGTRRAPGRRPATESDLAKPVGAYQTSKLDAERLVADYVSDGGDAVTVHPTSVVGPGDEYFTGRLCRLVTGRIPVYLPGGASFVGVDDAVGGIAAAMRGGRRGEHYLLGGENLTYGEALEVFADAAGPADDPPSVRVPASVVRAAGPAVGAVNAALGTRFFPVNTRMARLATETLFYDSSKARRDLGYDPAPLDEHVDEAVAWWRERV
ncbi:NAD-dependent epimerase/dehydratase family protein [Halospeciosus flavus]|uniref:NAD-dependent epimerase/dehydratase family protein n=1 Tax=Halospeciosus flavus TaxID=3032283 RepID=A0ABD5Z1C8_9EURY|nr:NAD-dependent epimerase/dehydratase family protein [Halospeciosus flavus]